MAQAAHPFNQGRREKVAWAPSWESAVGTAADANASDRTDNAASQAPVARNRA